MPLPRHGLDAGVDHPTSLTSRQTPSSCRLSNRGETAMSRATTLYPQHREQECSLIGTQGRTSSPRSRMGWHPWLSLRSAERRRARLQRLDHLWDAQREQVWTQTDSSYRDFVIKERGPALRLAIYQHLAMS